MSTPSPRGIAEKIARAMVLLPEPDPPAMPKKRLTVRELPQGARVFFQHGVETRTIDVAPGDHDDEIHVG